MTASAAPTTLAKTFRRLIRDHGPISVSRYMGESNARYYASRDPLGTTGDFVTAPEISQMFGEIVGLWLADVWVRAGRPANVVYVELGPGRGTLARDSLRAMATQGLRPQVHLVEGSEALRSLQADALAGARFHETVDTLPDHAPMLLVANEFFDALPVRQLVCTEAGWRERMIALDKKAQFVFVAGDNPMDEALPADRKTAPPGTIIETSPAAAALAGEIARRLDVQGGAAVFIDYGHLEPRTGSTLQAVRVHEKVGLFDAPGDMDLTAHVDFAMLGQIAARAGLASATATQGEWLSALGIGQRAQALTARSPERAQDIAQAHDRLVGTDEMGDLFKVMALSPPDWPRGMGFAEGDTE